MYSTSIVLDIYTWRFMCVVCVASVTLSSTLWPVVVESHADTHSLLDRALFKDSSKVLLA